MSPVDVMSSVQMQISVPDQHTDIFGDSEPSVKQATAAKLARAELSGKR